jgi:hypothetical protein
VPRNALSSHLKHSPLRKTLRQLRASNGLLEQVLNQAPMMTEQSFSPNNLRIASPCSVGWERMTGDDQVRFCSLCHLHVYNLSEMTGDQVRALVMKTEGRICARLYRRADGTVITRDCPVGLRAFRRRLSRAAGAAAATILSMCSVAFAQSSSKKERSCTHVSQLRIKRTPQKGNEEIFTGAIKNEKGAVIPGANVSLTDERTKRRLTIPTTDEGRFSFPSLPTGRYTVEVKAAGFKTFKLKHLQINADEEALADIILNGDAVTVTVGIVVDTQMIESSNGTTTIRGDLIQKLPIPE